MNRERNEGSRKKDYRKEREGSQAADDRDRRPQLGAKAHKTQGILESEARMQIRELRSRYG